MAALAEVPRMSEVEGFVAGSVLRAPEDRKGAQPMRILWPLDGDVDGEVYPYSGALPIRLDDG